MSCKVLSIWILLITVFAPLAGCVTRDPGVGFHDDLRHYEEVLTATDYADSQLPPQAVYPGSVKPAALRQDSAPAYLDLPLGEAIRTGLANTTVLADLGGSILQAPQSVEALQNPSIVETDPRFGVAAALSAFDADLITSAFFENNDRVYNNRFVVGTFEFMQDRHDYETALRKRSATGTEYILRQTWDYDANNSNGNLFPSAWDTAVEAEFRHPLMRGGGIDFNRIAGPYGTPGNLNGVVIARINTDISLADLEVGLRNYVSNVENAYWDLYFAYRDLDAKKRARDHSFRFWKELEARGGLPGAEADKVEQAREQYFRFEADVENALSGRLVQGTQSENDTTGGTFRANGGVYVAERRLRLLLGLPLNGEELLRPAEDPSLVKVKFDWDSVVGECLIRRAELRRQRLQIQRRELELIASRNFLKPQLDAVGRYRWRGFGDDLLNYSRGTPPNARYDDAYSNLTSGDFQEWQLGVEFSMPLGFRQGHATMRHAELLLARERAILERQERHVLHDLSNAVSEMGRAYSVAQINFDRRTAAVKRLKTLQDNIAIGRAVDASDVLDAQQRLAAAESDFFRALVEYALAVKNVHVEKGTWKSYHEVFLAEDLSCPPQGYGLPPAMYPQPAPQFPPEVESPEVSQPAPLTPPPAFPRTPPPYDAPNSEFGPATGPLSLPPPSTATRLPQTDAMRVSYQAFPSGTDMGFSPASSESQRIFTTDEVGELYPRPPIELFDDAGR